MSAPEPTRNFDEPWQATAWVLAQALRDKGVFSGEEWSQMLGRRVRARSEDDNAAYYTSVLEALETLLVEKKAASAADLAALKEAWRDAYERTPHGKPVELRRKAKP